MIHSKKIEVDPVSRQTLTTPNSFKRQASGGDIQDSMWHPEITSRAKSYQSSYGGSVYDRLYTRAIEQMTDHHNAQVEYIQSKVALPMKPWEVPRSKEAGAASWAQVMIFGDRRCFSNIFFAEQNTYS
jgi:hypothetical protein